MPGHDQEQLVGRPHHQQGAADDHATAERAEPRGPAGQAHSARDDELPRDLFQDGTGVDEEVCLAGAGGSEVTCL